MLQAPDSNVVAKEVQTGDAVVVAVAAVPASGTA